MLYQREGSRERGFSSGDPPLPRREGAGGTRHEGPDSAPVLPRTRPRWKTLHGIHQRRAAVLLREGGPRQKAGGMPYD